MPNKGAVRLPVSLAFALAPVPAETLGDALRRADVPTRQFAATELAGRITSYAVNAGEPFLLAYYTDDGSGRLHPPLHVLRYARRTASLQRAELRNATALFHLDIPIDCLGSALHIREVHGLPPAASSGSHQGWS